MDGYVMNASPSWTHAMKRAVGPGQKIQLSELYSQYGVKHNIAEGKEFVEWLKSVKLKDHTKWKIVFKDDIKDIKELDVVIDAEQQEEAKKQTVKAQDSVTPLVKSKMDISDIVNFTVREAKDRLTQITDLNLLKYAYQEANQMSGKDSLCRLLRKRIKELQMGR